MYVHGGCVRVVSHGLHVSVGNNINKSRLYRISFGAFLFVCFQNDYICQQHLRAVRRTGCGSQYH